MLVLTEKVNQSAKFCRRLKQKRGTRKGGKSNEVDCKSSPEINGIEMRKQRGKNHPQLTQRNQEEMARASPSPSLSLSCVLGWKRNRGSQIANLRSTIDEAGEETRCVSGCFHVGPGIDSTRMAASQTLEPMTGRLGCTPRVPTA